MAVSRAAALCVSYVNLCSRGKQLTRTLSYVLMSLCSSVFRVSGQPSHATAPALMSLEATRTIIRGRQPCSGLMCILCKLMFLCSRGKRQAQTLYLMSLCSSVSRVSGQRTKQQTSNGTACHITTLIALFLSQIYPLTLVHKLIICKFAITCHLCQYMVYSTSRANKGFGEFWKQCAACWIAYTRLHKTIKCHNNDTPNKQSAGQYVWNHTTGAHTRTIYISRCSKLFLH